MSSATVILLHFFFIYFSFSWVPVVICLSSTVLHLPGYHGTLPFHLETGYEVVDEVNNVQLFYYFCKSERNPSEDPLVLWLTGGPGCSALSGLTLEIGPINFERVEFNGSIPTLALNPYSWTKVANIIFLDSPVGTGFSFSSTPEGYFTGDVSSSKQVHTFLLKWLDDHPEFLSNPFYVAGDSYAGKIVPVVTQEILEGVFRAPLGLVAIRSNDAGVEAGKKPLVNLKGYLVGNPTVDLNAACMSRIPYAYGLGIIPYELYESATKNCKGDSYDSPGNADCARDLNIFENIISELSMGNILEPVCQDVTKMLFYEVGNRRSLKEDHKASFESLTPPETWCRVYEHYLSYLWANFQITRRALGIQKGTVREWKRCNSNLSYSIDVPDDTNYFLSVHKKGCRALIYSGDHDISIPTISTENWIRSLNLCVTDEWRSWLVHGQVAGYTRTYADRLTFATVKGGGHTAPTFRPRECLAMFERWISRKPL